MQNLEFNSFVITSFSTKQGTVKVVKKSVAL